METFFKVNLQKSISCRGIKIVQATPLIPQHKIGHVPTSSKRGLHALHLVLFSLKSFYAIQLSASDENKEHKHSPNVPECFPLVLRAKCQKNVLGRVRCTRAEQLVPNNLVLCYCSLVLLHLLAQQIDHNVAIFEGLGWSTCRGPKNCALGEPCLCPLPKMGGFDENGESDDSAFYQHCAPAE